MPAAVIIIGMAEAVPLEHVATAADIMFLLPFLQVNVAVMTIRKKYGDKLSGQCETALYQAASVLDRAIGTVAYLADQCRADIESKCASVPSGQGRIAECLAGHKDSLSPPCTQAISTVRAQIE